MEALVRELETQGTTQTTARTEGQRLLCLPLAEGTGPQNRRVVVRDLFQQHYKDLLRHARRHIHQDELAGEIPRDALDPKDIVDEVARKAMAKVNDGPNG